MARLRALPATLAAAAALATLLAAPAGAATQVTVSGGDLDVVGGGEGSAMTITQSGGSLRVADAGAAMAPSAPCSQDGADAVCPAAGVTRLDVQLNHGWDNLTIDPAIAIAAVVKGGSGNDTLRGGAGTDSIEGEDHDDTLYGGAGADGLIGGTGIDVAVFSDHSGPVTVTLNDAVGDGANGGAEGDDAQTEQAAGGPAADTLTGDGGANRLDGLGGSDTLRGGDGADTLEGGPGGDDVMHGGGGGDTFWGRDGDDTLHGDAGNDALWGEDGKDSLSAGEGDDALRGGEGRDPLLDGGGGNDTLRPDGYGPDPVPVNVIDGGPGSDTADLGGFAPFYPYGGVAVSLDGLPNDSDGTGADNLNVMGTETLKGTGGGADVLVGSAGDDVIEGAGSRPDVAGGVGDRIEGLGGDDTIRSDANNDTLDGGEGTDLVDLYFAPRATYSLDDVRNDGANGGTDLLRFENLKGPYGTSTLIGNAGPNELAGGIEPSTLNGLGGGDVLTGGPSGDTLNGGDDGDALAGAAGPDTLNGGPGDDTLEGGSEGDDLVGDEGRDLADYRKRYQDLTITLDGQVNDAGEGDDVRTEDVATSIGDDHITGDDGPNVLDAGAGDNTVLGGGGDDLLFAGGGRDVLTGDEGFDTVSYADRTPGVSVTLGGAADDGRPGEQDDVSVDRVAGSPFADTIVGTDAAEWLEGGGGDDTIRGLGGDDMLVGEAGGDRLESGAGADALRAADGEPDTLVCDTADGKDVVADSADDAASCGMTGGGVGGPGAGPVTQLDTFVPLSGGGLPPVAGRPAAPSLAALLASALVDRPPRGRVTLRTTRDAFALGEFTCPAAACSATASLRSDRRLIGRGSWRLGDEAAVLLVTLNRKGRAAVARRALAVTATVTLATAGARTTERLALTIRRGRRG
jgi:Ca2+-binding RTX toxin-like protein